MKRKFMVLMILELAMMSCPVNAEFDDSWDWHNVTVENKSQYKTEIHYCFDSSFDNETQWQNWIRNATKNWNDSSTGWTLTETTTVPCQVTISLKDIPASENSGGAYVSYDSADRNGRISRSNMVFDTNLSDELWDGKAPSGWGTTGNDTLDPVVVAKHEFSHVLRMDHTGKGTNTGNLEDPVSPGNHDHNLSESDKNEAKKGIVNRGANISSSTITPSGGDIEFGKFIVNFPAGSLHETANVSIRPLSQISTPAPINVPAGTDAIIIGVDIRTDLPIEELEIPATVTISYTTQDIAGAYFIGDSHVAPLGHVDESTLKAFSYDRETKQWNEVPCSVVDANASTITFDTTSLEYLGIGAGKVYEVPTANPFLTVGVLGIAVVLFLRRELK